MKKAIIDQLFLGFLLLMGIVTFIATVHDETSTRNRIYDLKDLVKSSAKAMARYYENNIDMCTAQSINTNILLNQKIGTDSINSGLVSYKWWDMDSDGEPDQVTATIAQHPHATFWYKFFDKDSFTIGPFSWTEPVNTPKSVTLTYGGEDAGYTNMVGLYELDNNNCVTNPRIILANSDDPNKVGQLLNNGQAITSPPTHVFLISDGYNLFRNGNRRPSESSSVSMDHCFSDVTNNRSNPRVTINGVTRNSANVYFEQNELNGDGYHHIQIIPHNVWGIYNHFVNGTGPYNGQGRKSYDQFIAECNRVNYDNIDYNNLPSTDYEEGENDCINDRNNQYHYAMEDLNGGGDEDFNDIFLNSTRVVIPNQLNSYIVQSDSSINLTCTGNNAPDLTIQCPSSINKGESTTIMYTASDVDGHISSKIVSAINGTTLDKDGSILYTPDNDFHGIDTVSLTVQDNEGLSTTKTCTITVNDVNLPPTIIGTPMTELKAGENYIFTPIASDPEGQNLTFSISNRPSWLNFSQSTGQLSGVPSNSNVGTFSNIIISVSDGTHTVSLDSFNIKVIEDTSNNPPQCANIPTQTVIETNQFNLNLNNYCNDSDGDNLTYTITQSSLNINQSTDGNISITIPDNTAYLSPLLISVKVDDGTDSINTSFTLNINANPECEGPFNSNFNSNKTDGWMNGAVNSNNMLINGKGYAHNIFNFGTMCKNKDVNLSFDYRTNNKWENSDKFELYINTNLSNPHERYDKTNNNWKTINTTVQTDNNGQLAIYFFSNTDKANERVRIDNINLSQ